MFFFEIFGINNFYKIDKTIFYKLIIFDIIFKFFFINTNFSIMAIFNIIRNDLKNFKNLYIK